MKPYVPTSISSLLSHNYQVSKGVTLGVKKSNNKPSGRTILKIQLAKAALGEMTRRLVTVAEPSQARNPTNRSKNVDEGST